jgi:hypothetical protein
VSGRSGPRTCPRARHRSTEWPVRPKLEIHRHVGASPKTPKMRRADISSRILMARFTGCVPMSHHLSSSRRITPNIAIAAPVTRRMETEWRAFLRGPGTSSMAVLPRVVRPAPSFACNHDRRTVDLNSASWNRSRMAQSAGHGVAACGSSVITGGASRGILLWAQTQKS